MKIFNLDVVLLTVLIFTFTIFNSCDSASSVSHTCDTYTELPDPTSDTTSDWTSAQDGLQVSFVSIDKRYPKSLFPKLEKLSGHKVTGWKGERLSAQVLLWTNADVDDVEVNFSDFVSEQTTLPSGIAKARFVRYVMTDEYADGCGHRNPADFAASLSPDMLDDLKCFDLPAKKVRPVWLTVEVPADAHAGTYLSTIEITSQGQETETLELTVEVIDQTLPDPSEWVFHLDQWQHPSAVARVEQVELWSKEHFEAMEPVMQMLVDAGQKVITATLNKDPWNVQTYDPYADMIFWTKERDGSWTYDYTIFDKWIEFMMDLGVNKMINCYSIVPWNNEIHYFDRSAGDTINVVAKPGTNIFEEIWTPFLIDFSTHLKSKGWLEITNIAMDERDRESMDATLDLLRRVTPELGVSYADNQKSYQRYPKSEDISVSAYHPLAPKDVISRRKNGLNTTFYVCCSDPFPNQFTFSEPAESTYLAWYALAVNLDGMLRWAFNSWVENPTLDSRFRTWPAGDTYIVYPQGRSSIRYERMLEGIQDYEKARILRKQLLDNGAQEKLDVFNAAIEKLSTVQKTDHWNNDLNAAKELLNKYSKDI